MEEVNGKRNLIILGVSAILIASITTSLSLWIYRSTGDIYLDRSRPGYLPDDQEVEEGSNGSSSSFVFNENGGGLTQEELDEYLKELKAVDDRIKALSDPYAPGPLSNESLGIPASEQPQADQKD